MSDWHAANQRWLVASLTELTERMRVRLAPESAGPVALDAARIAVVNARGELDEPPALERIEAVFGLSPFERDVLL